jgi:hypothetical protein
MRIDPDTSRLFNALSAETESGSGIVGLARDPRTPSEEFHVYLTFVALDSVNDGALDFGPTFVLSAPEIPDRALHVLVAGQATVLGQKFTETGNVVELVVLSLHRFAWFCLGEIAR